VALLKYIGPKSADSVVAFYKDNMPLYDWNPINVIEYDRRVLTYENKYENCTVSVEPRGKNKSIVTISISPKSQPMSVEGYKESEKKSKK